MYPLSFAWKFTIRAFFLFASFLILSGFYLSAAGQNSPEFRGVWIATVDNIDWPARGNVLPDSQRAAFVRLLDFHRSAGINTVIVQVRPCADAFYPSPIEPWSEWLTGVQGMSPSPYYDPLEFMITEAHKRKMAFHAWMNPYRAEFNPALLSTSPTHITRLHPDWFITYANKRYFDPGNPAARNYVSDVVEDLVNRYAVDAVHFDDYFYPYQVNNQAFPDTASYRRYANGQSLADWRRSNTDSIIVAVGRVIARAGKKVRFGVSPFGIWRNRSADPVEGSNTDGGLSNYDDLYADILKWLKLGWIDYVCPQLYWEFEHKQAPFGELLDWWSRHTYGRDCYIGLGIYKSGSNPAWSSRQQLPRQIRAIRSKPQIGGMAFYSSKYLEKNVNGWTDSLRVNYFNEPAQAPDLR
jgi:uncharacterized lipoprotein YddW (UPF0748 family)